MQIGTYISTLQKTIEQLPVELIENLVQILQEARLAEKQVFIMGNGGSASTASHFVCDLAKNTRKEGWPNFKVIGLTDNMAIFSAYANDDGYENVFAHQLANLVQPGDIVIGISASGNSPNVLNAIDEAKRHKAMTVGFTGFDGGKLRQMVDFNIHVESNIIEHVEDIHLMLEHMIVLNLKSAEPPNVLRRPSLETTTFAFKSDEAVSRLFGQPTAITKGQTEKSTFELLYNISKELAEKLDLHTMLERILELTLNSVRATSGSIVVLDEDGCIIEGAFSYEGEMKNRQTQQLADIMEQGLAGWVVENRQAVLIPDTTDDPRWLHCSWDQGRSRSALSVPLMSHDRVVGVLTMVHPEVGQFTREDLALLTAIALTVSVNSGTKLADRE